jgi:hypothetical protein
MQKEQFLEILKKYQDGNATAEEVEFLRTYYNLFELEPEVLNSLKEKEKIAIKDRIESRLMEQITGLEPANKKRGYRWIAAAASILLFLSVGGYFLLRKTQSVQQLAQNDIPFGTQHAILKIGKQQRISLDNTKNGLIASHANTSISKTGDGSISYRANTATSNITEPVYDTIMIPAGGRSYHLQLADGSKVLLNAATTFRFPETFANNKRPDVELITGEAYFEITHNEKAPLLIHIPHQDVEDIGTKFNISAYPDDADSRVTLAEGAIKVKAGVFTKEPAPGEQTIYSNNKLVISTANLTKVLAWTNGYFRFNDETITEVMKELARWYNIEVVYQGPITKERFNAKISRFKNISAVLRVLERTKGVHFKIEGRRVTVLSKL